MKIEDHRINRAGALKRVLGKIALVAITIAAALAFGSQAPQLYREWRGHGREGDFKEHVLGQTHQLTLYGTSTCHFCAKARTYLTEHRIPFNDMLVDQSPEANRLFDQLNEDGVPVLVSKTKLVSGYYPAEYADLAQAK